MKLEWMGHAAFREPEICHLIRSLTRGILLSIFLLTVSFCARAQGTADILGTVTDATGAVIPGATITLTNIGTNISATATSASNGDYIFPSVQIGTYTVKVDAKGFTTFTAAPFAVEVGDRARVDAKMQVGTQATTVEVTGAAPALQTDTATISTLNTSAAMENLPINSRNVVKLVWLSAGAAPSVTGLASGLSPDDRRGTSNYSINGQNSFVNNNMIDGVDNNEVLIATIAIKPSVDAIQEVDVASNIYDAQYTKTGGGNVNVITKSGTNDFHGSVYEFFRNKVLNTNPNYQFPANYSGCSGTGTGCTLHLTPFQPKPPFRQNQYGASLGGPIKKNKTFFFGDYERLQQAIGLPSVASVPTLCNRGLAVCPDGKTQLGDFSDIPLISVPGGGNQACVQNGTNCPYVDVASGSIDPLGLAYFSMYPLPNGPGIANNYVSEPTRTQTSDTFDFRVDQHLSDKDTLYGRYSFNNVNTLTPSSAPSVALTSAQDPLIASKAVTVNPGIASGASPFGSINGFPGPNHTREQGLAFTYNHVYSSNLIFTGKASYLRSLINSLSINGSSPGLATALGFPCNSVSCVNTPLPATNGIPIVAPSGLNSVGDSIFVPILYLDNTFEYSGTLSWTKGSETIKTGVNLIRRRATFGQSNNARGDFAFSGAFTGVPGADLLEGLSSGGGSQLRALTLVQPGLREWEPGAYVQDDWRAKHWLTLNLGVRYDIFTPYTEKNGRIANWNPATGLMMSPSIPGAQQSGPTAGVRTSYRNVAPRFGFAMSLPNQLVIRGGFGMSYFQDNIGSTSSMINPPFQFNFNCQTQNEVHTNNSCSAPFASAATANFGPAPAVPNSTVGQTGGPLLSAGIPAPSLNVNQVLAPASCPVTASPTSFGCTAAGGNNYATFSPSNVFLPNFPDNYLEQYSVQVQKQIGANVIQVGFVGNLGRDLRTSTYNPTNKPNPSAPSNPLAQAYPWLNNESFGIQNKWGSSSYQSLQAGFVRRFNKGLTTNINYTWSHSIWDGQGACQPVISFSELGYGNGPQYAYPCYYDNPKSPSNPIVVQTIDAGSQNSGNSGQDIRHRITWAVSYDLPFGKTATGIEKALIGGWSTNTAGAWQTGLPFSVSNGVSGITGVGPSGRPDQVCSGRGNHSELMGWINPNCFVLQTAGTFGNEHANQLFGPHQRDLDFSIFKTFPVTEQLKIEFRTEVYNLFNTPNFANPGGSLGCFGSVSTGRCQNQAGLGLTGDLFNPGNPTGLLPGTITSLASSANYNSRQIQFALKFLF